MVVHARWPSEASEGVTLGGSSVVIWLAITTPGRAGVVSAGIRCRTSCVIVRKTDTERRAPSNAIVVTENRERLGNDLGNTS